MRMLLLPAMNLQIIICTSCHFYHLKKPLNSSIRRCSNVKGGNVLQILLTFLVAQLRDAEGYHQQLWLQVVFFQLKPRQPLSRAKFLIVLVQSLRLILVLEVSLEFYLSVIMIYITTSKHVFYISECFQRSVSLIVQD